MQIDRFRRRSLTGASPNAAYIFRAPPVAFLSNLKVYKQTVKHHLTMTYSFQHITTNKTTFDIANVSHSSPWTDH
ncbi:hypothetical protein NPIL_684611 [Nephila pilipes]|uniref:Uncharacterized protein n=1 Tax=Nephila pilipes TaxID=299642 RepID=A0A8X6MSL6_NEPPI|nr:hypothetical protein NPIL_684611 [Nephila pilipes]